MALTRITFLFWTIAGSSAVASAGGADGMGAAAMERDFGGFVRPLIQRYCLACHSTEKQKGDLDLERFSTFAEVLSHPRPWQEVVIQLSLGEMPPRERPRPAPAERERLLAWADAALEEAAKARAGDPGPVVLRRLDNAEYTYTVRDLTGVESLDPVKEFPADGAAGEGFMNTGNSLVMSPALLTKYLDAGKGIAAHAVLLPDGFRFSPGTTRRDWTEEVLAEIREFYRRFTDPRGADRVNLQGIVFDTNEGGRLPVERYLEAALAARSAGDGDEDSLRKIAAERGLSAKYLASLRRVLEDDAPSFLLDGLRERFRAAGPAGAAGLAAEIARWQKALWKFSSVGHIGKAGGPKAWMEPVNPIAAREEVRLKLAAPPGEDQVVLYLAAGDSGDGDADDFVVWEAPRLAAPGRPDLPLRDARDFIRQVTARRERIFASTAKCLAAAAAADTAAAPPDLEELARAHSVDVEALAAWMETLGLGSSGTLEIDRFTLELREVSSHDFVNGWGSSDTPSLVANSSDRHVRIPGNLKPHGVAVHPSPKLCAAVGWRSPLAGAVRVQARVTHAHPECGNGVEWWLELRRGAARRRLAHGLAQGGGEVQVGPLAGLRTRVDDLVSLVIGARGGDHSCDLTDVELEIRSAGEDGREWSLTRDVSPDVLAGNPHADRFGNRGIWHFYSEPAQAIETGTAIPAGSLLALWQAAGSAPEKQALAGEFEKLLRTGPPPAKDSPDAVLYRQLTSLAGPLVAGARRAEPRASPLSPRGGEGAGPAGGGTAWSLDPALFGRHPDGTAIDPASLCVKAPSVLEVRLPADLVAGAEFLTAGSLHPGTGAEGSVQIRVTTTRPERPGELVAGEATVTDAGGPWTSSGRRVSHSSPILVNEGSAARRRIERGLDEFREWFPAALSYVKIVPVDEVVTLTLFHREDGPLVRLMLDEAQAARLDRLWDQLHFTSQDPLLLVDAFEQLWQYATQDADPKVFEPMRKPIADRAAAFRQRLIDTRPKHLDALVDFAALAYRRPLSEGESGELRALYRKLRDQEVSHEEAFRLTLARVFVAPAFLYRLEKAAPGPEPGPVTDWELASRLSYFLWSSAPDADLRRAAAGGTLHEPDVLAAEARRMLCDGRVRRLSTEFACAWLHIHGFDELDEKSERHFPTFAGLRGAMYEEAIRFFTDAFRRDAPVTELYDCDHTFLNEALAGHYGIPGVTGPDWRRVDGVKAFGRGGILGLGATLAKQSGASRTSPILRGNWVAEALLGERLPRPPKDVPRLPEDEAEVPSTVRQMVERHTRDPRCSGCHLRIDGYGFALEGYDAIGRARATDLAGRPLDLEAKLFDGTQVTGMAGLREYLLTGKRDALLRQFCRKLLGYALGREVALSDRPLVAEMARRLSEDQGHLGDAVEMVVTSKQFLQIRGREAAADD